MSQGKGERDESREMLITVTTAAAFVMVCFSIHANSFLFLPCQSLPHTKAAAKDGLKVSTTTANNSPKQINSPRAKVIHLNLSFPIWNVMVIFSVSLLLERN